MQVTADIVCRFWQGTRCVEEMDPLQVLCQLLLLARYLYSNDPMAVTNELIFLYRL